MMSSCEALATAPSEMLMGGTFYNLRFDTDIESAEELNMSVALGRRLGPLIEFHSDGNVRSLTHVTMISLERKGS
jgi:hypothetical protein